jgi:hemerythrin-like domain-containing protein
MTTTPHADNTTTLDGFEVLDACHRQILASLAQLRTLIERLESEGPDTQVRTLAREIGQFFSSTAREHHADEERHVFPKLLETGDDETKQAVMRLQQDHGWIEEDWLELAPQLDAVAMGMSSYDLDGLKAGLEVFDALSRDHIALEESMIYPPARNAMRPAERREMGREMAARRRARRATKPA